MVHNYYIPDHDDKLFQVFGEPDLGQLQGKKAVMFFQCLRQLYFFSMLATVVLNSFTANVADRRLGPPHLTLFKSLCLQTLCCVQSILDFDISNLGYLLNVIERKVEKIKF